MTSTAEQAHYADLIKQLGQALDDLQDAVGNPQAEAAVLTRIAGITSAKAALANRVRTDYPSMVADWDACIVAAQFAELAHAHAGRQPRRIQIPALERDAEAAATLDALTDAAGVDRGRADTIQDLAELLPRHAIGNDLAREIAGAYQRAVSPATPAGAITVAGVVLVAVLAVLCAATAVVSLVRSHDIGHVAEPVVAAGLAGYLARVLAEMLRERFGDVTPRRGEGDLGSADV